jgi:hypothetical protein
VVQHGKAHINGKAANVLNAEKHNINSRTANARYAALMLTIWLVALVGDVAGHFMIGAIMIYQMMRANDADYQGVTEIRQCPVANAVERQRFS